MDSAENAALTRRCLALGMAPDSVTAIVTALGEGDGRALVHELLLRGLWDDVVDESMPMPQWIDRWRALGANGFPLIDSAALERLVRAGADPHDLTDLVRSAQILTIYNIAQLLDDPTEALRPDLPESAIACLGCAVDAGNADAARPYRRLHALHAELLARDPSGRHGEPRSPEQRQLQAFPADVRAQLQELIEAGKTSQAAALWKKHAGGELRDCLDAVQRLTKP